MAKQVYENYAKSLGHKEFISTSSRSIQRHFRANILPHIPKDTSTSILDIGCGYGKYLKELDSVGYTNCLGIDISPDQLALAQEKGLSNVVLCDSLEFLRATDELYDVILLMDIVEHLELQYLIELLTLAFARLRPSGKVLLQTVNGLSPVNPFLFGDVTHLRAFTSASLVQLFRMTGYDLDIRCLPIFPPNKGVNRIRRLIWKSLFNPMLRAFMLAAHGSSYGGIYTTNILAVASLGGRKE